jgi:hypothetical protein
MLSASYICLTKFVFSFFLSFFFKLVNQSWRCFSEETCKIRAWDCGKNAQTQRALCSCLPSSPKVPLRFPVIGGRIFYWWVAVRPLACSAVQPQGLTRHMRTQSSLRNCGTCRIYPEEVCCSLVAMGNWFLDTIPCPILPYHPWVLKPLMQNSILFPYNLSYTLVYFKFSYH